jgi:hypothetical protein
MLWRFRDQWNEQDKREAYAFIQKHATKLGYQRDTLRELELYGLKPDLSKFEVVLASDAGGACVCPAREPRTARRSEARSGATSPLPSSGAMKPYPFAASHQTILPELAFTTRPPPAARAPAASACGTAQSSRSDVAPAPVAARAQGRPGSGGPKLQSLPPVSSGVVPVGRDERCPVWRSAASPHAFGSARCSTSCPACRSQPRRTWGSAVARWSWT